MPEVYHALGLHFHQPHGNMNFLLSTNREEALRILQCYIRPIRYLSECEGLAAVHLSISGTLLEQMCTLTLDELGSLKDALECYVNLSNVEFLATGFYHPVFPLIPESDWKSHVLRWVRKAERLGLKFNGFWPPELGFTMKMIPLLSELGFKYVVVDGRYIEGGGEDRGFKPHLAEHSGAEITVIPRDEELSDAQMGGVTPRGFINMVKAKTSRFKGALLVTTWSDGENSRWFREVDESKNFWGYFFKPYVKLTEQDCGVTMTSISEFLKEHPPEDYVRVKTGAWKTFSNDGETFSQWIGHEAQREAMKEVWDASAKLRRLKALIGCADGEAGRLIALAEEHLLRAETSCNFFWEAKWLPKVYRDLNVFNALLRKAAEKAGLPFNP